MVNCEFGLLSIFNFWELAKQNLTIDYSFKILNFSPTYYLRNPLSEFLKAGFI